MKPIDESADVVVVVEVVDQRLLQRRLQPGPGAAVPAALSMMMRAKQRAEVGSRSVEAQQEAWPRRGHRVGTTRNSI